MRITDLAWSHYGKQHQLLKAAEELSELSAALCRYANGAGSDAEVLTECADVCICLQYVAKIIDWRDLLAEIDAKLDRLEKMIGDAKMKQGGY